MLIFDILKISFESIATDLPSFLQNLFVFQLLCAFYYNNLVMIARLSNQLYREVVFIFVLICQHLFALVCVSSFKSLHYLAIKLHILFSKGILKFHQFTKIRVRDYGIRFQVCLDLLRIFVRKFLADFVIDLMHSFITEASTTILAVVIKHLTVERCIIKVLYNMQNGQIFRLNFDRLHNNVFA